MCNLFDVDLKDIEAFAHSRKDCSEKEPFFEHSERTLKYYDCIFECFELIPILKRLLRSIDSELNMSKIQPLLRNIVKSHDVGKLTRNFQKRLDGSRVSETHSDKGFFVLTYNLLFLSRRKLITGKEFLFLLIMLYAVYKHHGNLN
ncbi:CRISPR-associated endonuclease Cas3'', partial [bacterium]|nr:CRISPR-associated endonuclease Cas3'' [bacterium]